MFMVALCVFDTVLAIFSHSQALLDLPHDNILKHTELAYTEKQQLTKINYQLEK